MWPDNINLTEDYDFKSSPESCSTDNMGSISDEDFMTQLSADLDIPLLLNPGEDDMGVLSSFLDQPDDILSDISVKQYFNEEGNMDIKDFDFLNEVLHFPQPKGTPKTVDSFKTKGAQNTNNTSVNSNNDNKGVSYFDFLNEAVNSVNTQDISDVKLEEQSDESCSSRNSLEPSTPPPIIPNKKQNDIIFFSTNILPKKEVKSASLQVVPQRNSVKALPVKRVPIKPKAPYTVPVKNPNVVVIKSEFPNKEHKIIAPNTPNIVVLDNFQVNSFKTISPAINKPVTMPSITLNSNNRNIDPRILKRQERRIKNRESASMSRKKKKDYLNSLEEQVKDLTAENRRLVEENKSLKERLSAYEDSCKFSLNTFLPKSAKPAFVLCAFLFVLTLNVNLLGGPLLRNQYKMGLKGNEYPKLANHRGRNLLWTSENSEGEKLNQTYFSALTMCPASINQTESARLLLELERWIGKPEPQQNAAFLPEQSSHKLKPKTKRKKLRIDTPLPAQFKKREKFGPENEDINGIQLFRPQEDQLYSEFFQAINRQDDTFYVVSFSEQHMLLPALYHNKTRRPKMSLLMPSVYPNDTSNSTYVPLMQIDCEVQDTKLVNVKFGSIPKPYRQYGNATTRGSPPSKNTHDTSNSRKIHSKRFKPYALKAVDFANNDIGG